MTAAALAEKRNKLIADARQILDAAQGGSLSAEQTVKYDAIMADVDGLKANIDRMNRLDAEDRAAAEQRTADERAAALAGRRTVSAPAAPEQRGNAAAIPTASEEYRGAYWQGFRNDVRSLDATEFRALSVGTDSAGGYTVPDEFERRLIKQLEVENVMRRLCAVIRTSSGTREIPMDADSGVATWGAEASSYSESDAAFTNATIGAHKLKTLLKVSEELLTDSAFDIEGYVLERFGSRFGRAEEAAFVNGTGATQPAGVVGASSLGKAFAGAAAVTTDELIDLFHALSRVYRERATWMASDAMVKLIRKLKDTTNQYLWQPGLTSDKPDTLLGRPVVVSDDVPAPTTGNKSIIFGDFKHYIIADRQSTVTQRLNELYAANGQIGFRGYRRVDGKLIKAAAVVHGIQA